MTNENKIAYAGLGALAWYLYARQPRIIIIKKNPAAGSVTFRMSIGGYNITDTVFFSDNSFFIPVGDGKHIFAGIINPTFRTMELSIGYNDPTGGYKAIKAVLLSQ